MPDEARQIVASTILRDLIGRVAQALEAGTFTARDDAHITWRPIHLDEVGWLEVVKILASTFEAITEAEVQAANRMTTTGDAGFDATVALLGFESPSAS